MAGLLSGTGMAAAPEQLRMTWPCPGTFESEEYLFLTGTTAGGSPVYSDSTGTKHFYYEPMCGGEAATAAWVLSLTAAPDRCALHDLDKDGDCASPGQVAAVRS